MTDRRPPSKPMPRSSHRLVLAMVSGFFLGACAYPHDLENVVHDSNQHRVAGSAGSVVVTEADDQIHALPLAEQHCEGRGKTAKFNRMTLYHQYAGRRISSDSAEFDCILTDRTQPGYRGRNSITSIG